MPPDNPVIDEYAAPPDSQTGSAFEIHRSIVPPACFLLGCTLFITLWMLELFIGIDAEFMLTPGFTAYIALFVTPVALLMTYLIINREPVLAVRGSCLYLTHIALAWRRGLLPLADVLHIETDWIPGRSHARIVFHVTPERFDKQVRSGPWIKRKNDRLYLEILNTNHTPDKAAEVLRSLIQQREPE